MQTLADTVYHAARSLIFFGRQVIFSHSRSAPAGTPGVEIFLISPAQLDTFEPRLHFLLNQLTTRAALDASPFVPANASPVSGALVRILACELLNQFLNLLVPINSASNATTYNARQLQFNTALLQSIPAATVVRERPRDVPETTYAFQQENFLTAVINAAIYFAADRFDVTNIPMMLHGSFLKPSRVPLLQDLASWIAHVYHVVFSSLDERELADVDGYIIRHFRRLAEYIAYMPYQPRAGQVMRWIHRLDVRQFPNSDTYYLQRMLLHASSRNQNVVRLLHTSVPLSVVDLGTNVVAGGYNSLWRGDSRWGPTASSNIATYPVELIEKLMPCESMHILMNRIVREGTPITIGPDAAAAPDTDETIKAGIFGLWRPNPLVKRRSEHIADAMQEAQPDAMHTRKDVLKQVLNNHKLGQQDQQVDGTVRQHPIAAAMVAFRGGDSVDSFDEDQVYQERVHQISTLVAAPLQTRPMPEADWRKLIADSVSAATKAATTTTTLVGETGIHKPVPGVEFY